MFNNIDHRLQGNSTFFGESPTKEVLVPRKITASLPFASNDNSLPIGSLLKGAPLGQSSFEGH